VARGAPNSRNLTGSPALGYWLSDGIPEIEDGENQPRTDEPSIGPSVTEQSLPRALLSLNRINNQHRPQWSGERFFSHAPRTSDEPSRPTRQISSQGPWMESRAVSAGA